MKKFINEHPKLYWMIVGVLAVIVFSIVTAVGCAKLEKVNGAESKQYTVAWGNATHTFDVADGQYYAYLYWVEGNGWRNYMFMVSSEPFDMYDYADGTYAISSPSGGSVWKAVSKNGGTSYEETYSSYIWQNMYGIGYASSVTVYSNCDIVTRNTGGLVVFSANPLLPEAVYTLDAPYTSFQKVVVNRKIVENDILNNFYNDYMTSSSWKYHGLLNNVSVESDRGYQLEGTYLVQLPTVQYVLDMYARKGVDLAVDSEISLKTVFGVFEYLPELVAEWQQNKKTPYVEYEFDYVFDLVPDGSGNFSYQLTFSEVETLIKYWNPSVLEEFKGYSDYFRAIYMTFFHMECVTSAVKTTRDDSVVYGKVTTNQFGRGIYDTCIEVIPDVDINTATPEEIDKIIEEATQEAHDKYIKDLEDRLEELETQIDNATGSLGSFDSEFEGVDMWEGIKSVGSGLLGMTGFLGNIATVLGNLFVFLPYDVRQIAGYFFMASLLIALWKLIKR